jgi:hypothetical protein
MPKITKHVPVRRGFDTVWLKPGDDLPDWAEGMVGDHALASAEASAIPVGEEPAGPEIAPDLAPAVEPDAEAEVESEAEAAPDFTKPVATKRGRPRKQV